MSLHSSHDRFLHAVHRRLVGVHAVERAGICAGVAGGFSLVGAMVLWSRGEDALMWSAGAVLAGAIIGLTWGLIRRPRLLDAAFASDRQFKLSDLLSTALSHRKNDDPWARAVLAIADDRCRALSPSTVVLHRLGGRAWGGIGLSLALVMTIGVMSNLTMQRSVTAQAGVGETARVTGKSTLAGAKRQARGGDLREARAGALEHQTRGRAPDANEMQSRSFDEGDNQARASVSASDHASSDHRAAPGIGATASSNGHAHSPRQPPRGNAPGRSSGGGGSLSSGGGTAAHADSSGNDSTGAGGRTTASGDAASHDPVPWHTVQWSNDRESAMRRVEGGKVPDNALNVVRQYFRQ